MPVNEFDRFSKQPYVSTYTPLPLEYLAGIAKNLQGEHDQGVKAADDFSKLGQAIKASPVGEGIKQQLIGEMNSKMNELYNSTKSYASPDFKRKVQDFTNQYANDPRITYLRAEKDLFEQNQKDMADKNNQRDINYTYSKLYDPETNTYRQAKDISELPLTSRITKYADAYKAQADIMGNIASSMSGGSKGYDFSHPQSGVGPGGEYYAFNKITNQVEKVDKNDIDRIATASLPLYAKTDAGTFELQKEAQKYIGDKAHGLDYDKLSQLASQDDGYAALKETIDQKFKQDLTAVGQKQIFSKSTYAVDNMTLGDRAKSAENDASNFGKIITTNEQGNPEATDVGNVLEGLGLHKILDAKGDWISNGPLTSKYVVTKIDGTKKEFDNSIDAHKFAGNTGSIEQTNIGSNKSADQIVNEGYKVLAQKSKDLGLPTPKDGKYKDQLYNYALQIAKQRSTTSNLQPNTSKNLTAYFLGENSNIHNMEVYPQGDQSSTAKATNEEVATMAKNSQITGIDYYGDNQAGWKIAVTPKDDKGNPTDVDKALIGVPRDKVFEQETKSVWTISKGALQFAKTGKVSEEYKDNSQFERGSDITVHDKLQQYSNNHIAGNPKIAASSTEYDEKGNRIIRGSFTQYINGKPQLFAIEFNPNYVAPIIKSLDEVQNDKTTELQIKGSLNQYINKLGENTKPSEVSQ